VAQVYADEDIHDVLDGMSATPVVGSGNIMINSPPWDEGVFLGSQAIEGVCIVHPVQVYLDLWRLGDRGREAAEVLRRQCLGF